MTIQHALMGDYRVLDLSTNMGALCGKSLGELGMEVIKVEPPKGDPSRKEPPFASQGKEPENSLRFLYLNAGKRGITLDLSCPQGRDIFLDLVEYCDVVLENYPPGYLESIGLDYPALCQRQSKLVLASISPFGQRGPYSNYLGPDLITTAMGGLLYISGTPDLPPCMPPETQSHYYGSLCAAYGVMLGLWQRETKGVGTHVDTSIQAGLALHEHVAFTYSLEGTIRKRAGSQHHHVAPANLFPCQDGYISIFATQQHWPALLEVWEDHPFELDDPRWMDNSERRNQADWINKTLSRFTSQHNKEDLTLILQKRGIPALPVNSPSEFMEDPHVQHRQFFTQATHPQIGSYQQMGAPFKINGERPKSTPAPLLGEHNLEIYCDQQKLHPEDLKTLTSQGVI